MDDRHDAAEPVSQVPYFWSDQYGIKVQMAGWAHGYDEVVEVGAGGPGSCQLLGRDGRLVAALGWSAPGLVARQRNLIANGSSLSDAVAAAEGSRGSSC